MKNPIKSIIRSVGEWAGVNIIQTTQANYLATMIGNYSNVNATPRNALTYSAVLACVVAISETVAALPFRVYENQNTHWTPSTNHPLNYRISTAPNIEDGKIDFLETLIASVLLWGNGYARIVKNDLMRVDEYQFIHPSLVKPFRSESGRLYYAVRNPNLETVDIINPDELIHVKDISVNGIEGVSRIRSASTSIEVGMSSTQFGKNFFENGANMSGALETDGEMSDDAMERLTNQWDSKYTGQGNSSKTVILEEGLKYKRIGIPPNDAQFLETRQFSKEEIAMIFRVPPSKIGILEKTSYSSLEQQNTEWVQNLTPLVKKIEEEFTRKSFRDSEKGQFRVKLDFNSLLRADKKTRTNAQYYHFLMGVLSPNEIRLQEGMAPRSDEDGSAYYVPMNLENVSKPDEDGSTE